MFVLVMFLGVLMPIVGFVVLLMLRLLDQELDVLELENIKVRLEKELQESEYRQLTERIQPHFLFNALNAFLSLSRIGRHRDITEGLERFSLFLRYRYQDHEVLVPFATELEHTENYLAVQQLRFGRRLTIIYDIDQALIGCKIPPYTLQTLVENAFKHGLEKRAGAKECMIVFTREGNWVSLKVFDNGPDRILKPTYWKGTGLHNIQKRFQLIFDLTSAITLSETKDGRKLAHAYWPYLPGDDLE
jgi:two-component system, LytTR family, sensor histidine kinase AlgZ